MQSQAFVVNETKFLYPQSNNKTISEIQENQKENKKRNKDHFKKQKKINKEKTKDIYMNIECPFRKIRIIQIWLLFRMTHHNHVLMSELSDNGDKCQLSLQTNTSLSGPYYLGFGFDLVLERAGCTIGID